MGTCNKLALAVDGVPLLRRIATTLLDSRVQELVVVIGHQETVVRSILEDLPLVIVRNRRYREGQMTSVHRGMAALGTPCDGVLVCLSDQPLLDARDIERLVACFGHGCPTSVQVPTYLGRRGNPVILSWQHRATILAGGGKMDCRRMIANNPQLVTYVEMDNDHVVFDVDTPEDYERLRQRLGSAGETAPAAVTGR
jgi:molybdenum cofactor cytidylyltransferase